VSESHPLGGHLVDVGCLEVGVTQDGEFVVTQFIRHDVDDVGMDGMVRFAGGPLAERGHGAPHQQRAEGRDERGDEGKFHRLILALNLN